LCVNHVELGGGGDSIDCVPRAVCKEGDRSRPAEDVSTLHLTGPHWWCQHCWVTGWQDHQHTTGQIASCYRLR